MTDWRERPAVHIVGSESEWKAMRPRLAMLRGRLSRMIGKGNHELPNHRPLIDSQGTAVEL